MRMERELTEKEKKERVLYRFTRPATSVRRLWERCHLRVLIHDGIILFQGNFWAFLRGAALMRSSNLRSSSNPDFRFVPGGGEVLLKIIFHSIADFLAHREPVSRLFFCLLSPPPSPFLFYFRESRFRRENDRGNVKMKNFSKFSFKIYSYSIENRCSKFTAVSPIQIWQSPLHNSNVRKS